MPAHLALFMKHPPVAIVIGCAIALYFHFNRDGAGFRFVTSAKGRNIAAGLCIARLGCWKVAHVISSDFAIRPWANRWCADLCLALCRAGRGALVRSGDNAQPGPVDPAINVLGPDFIRHRYLYPDSIYVVKDSVVWFRDDSGCPIRFGVVTIFDVLCVVGVASVSYYGIERPFLKSVLDFAANLPQAETRARIPSRAIGRTVLMPMAFDTP